jgi:hypothetical protein
VTVTKTDNFGKTSPKPPFVDASVDARDTSLRVLIQQGPNFTLKTRIFRIFPEDEKIRCFVDVSSVTQSLSKENATFTIEWALVVPWIFPRFSL